MAGFLKGGPRPNRMPGPPKGAHQFLSRSSSNMPMPPHPAPSMQGDGKETKIIHHPDGTHEIHHSDGEVTKHPNAGHAAAHFHAKHSGGEVANMHSDGGTVTTHHVGPDGEVNGPMEHASPEEGANQMASMMNGDGNEMPMDNEPDGDEGEAYG